LWGESYGSYLFQEYAIRHPQHVRSAVLSGAYPIGFDPWGLDRLRAARRAIHLVCERTHACAGDAVLRDISVVAARLRNRPDTFSMAAGSQRLNIRLDEAALAGLVYTSGDAKLFSVLPGAVARGRAGDLAPLRQLVQASKTAQASMFDPRMASSISPAQSLATQCRDYPRAFSLSDSPAVRRSAFQHARSAIAADAFRPFSPAAWTSAGFEASDTCIAWPRNDSRPLRSRPMPDVPALVLSGDLDANTPSSAARQVARQFPRGAFTEIPNAGHTPTDSGCGLELALHFVATADAHGDACKRTETSLKTSKPSRTRVGQRAGADRDTRSCT